MAGAHRTGRRSLLRCADHWKGPCTMETEVAGVASQDAGPTTSVPLVEAKLSAPSIRQDLVRQSGVLDALAEDAGARLIVFEAPAGYGKSTAMRSWCATQDAALMWVTLDSGDDDPTRLWTYIASAIERILPGLAHPVLNRLEVPGSPVEQAVDELMTMLGRRRKPVILVLDDLHTVTDPDSLATIDHAIRYMPDNVRMLIGTRVEPQLALPRLRASQQLLELRASDLAFTADEAHTLLVRHGGLALTPDQVAALVDRTQGWPAMLVLARIWLRGHDDVAGAVAHFGGEQRFVADYLSSEVLDALDDDRRDFLQGIAVLGEFTPALCDAVLERTDSDKMIDDLQRKSLFVSRLEQGNWFRIHPLFAEYAQVRLQALQPGTANSIHKRAALWLAPRQPIEAMAHADAAGESALVAELLASHHLALIRSGAGRSLVHWARTLPDDVLIDFPDVAVAAAITTLLTSGGTTERTRYLGLVERALAERPGPTDAYAEAAALIAHTLALDGGVVSAVKTGRRAVDLTQEGLDPLADGALSALARALYFAGDLAEALNTAMAALNHPDTQRRVPTQIHARATLALVAVQEGRYASAQTHVDVAGELVGRIGTSRSWLGANASAARGFLLLAEGHAAEASRELATAERFFRDDVPTIHHAWLCILIASAQARRGRLDEASAAAQNARDMLAEIPDTDTLVADLDAVDSEIAVSRERAGAGDLVAMPSNAELNVLQLLAEDLSVRESADRLFVSENTVRTHRRSLYRKLGVHSREDAIARAGVLGMLDAHSPG